MKELKKILILIVGLSLIVTGFYMNRWQTSMIGLLMLISELYIESI